MQHWKWRRELTRLMSVPQVEGRSWSCLFEESFLTTSTQMVNVCLGSDGRQRGRIYCLSSEAVSRDVCWKHSCRERRGCFPLWDPNMFNVVVTEGRRKIPQAFPWLPAFLICIRIQEILFRAFAGFKTLQKWRLEEHPWVWSTQGLKEPECIDIIMSSCCRIEVLFILTWLIMSPPSFHSYLGPLILSLFFVSL